MFLPPKLQVALNIVSILVAAFFFAPTIAIVASWNALPGDQLYPTKRTLEKIALYITAPNYQTNSSLQTKLVARRTSEATTILLKKSSGEGLEELRAQAAVIRKQIREAPSAQAKRQAAVTAVHEFYRTKQKLALTKRTLALAPSPVTSSIPSSDQLVGDIEDTESDIDDIIDDIEDDPDIGAIPPPSPPPGTGTGLLSAPTGKEDDQSTPPGQLRPPPGQGVPQGRPGGTPEPTPTSTPESTPTPTPTAPTE